MSVFYSKDHEYIRVEGNIGTVGISDHAQGQLGDIVFVEIPSAGKVFSKGDEAAVVESVKAASDVYSPVSGKVTEANGELEGTPALVNEDAAGKGWFFKIELSDPSELDGLMNEEQYQAYLAEIA
jgi:glycine cleavage system H protein